MKNNHVQIHTLNKEEPGWWTKIFPCCATVEVEPDFEDCDYCRRRVYKNEYNDTEDNEPYMSLNRMKVRQKQPINIFCDKIDNNKLMK